MFDGDSAVRGIGTLLDVVRDMGLDPMKTADLKEGLFFLFNIETVHMPDLQGGRTILAPNHVSDLDAPILGLLHPRIHIVSKNDWTNNQELRRFLDIHYDLYGFDRASIQSLRALIVDAARYFNDSDENRHYLVFSQGTISDINCNSPARVSPIAQKIALRTGVPIIPMFIEQPSIDHPTRIVFDGPMNPTRGEDFGALWLERLKALQDGLDPPARRPVLTHRHAHNNKPGDPFF